MLRCWSLGVELVGVSLVVGERIRRGEDVPLSPTRCQFESFSFRACGLAFHSTCATCGSLLTSRFERAMSCGITEKWVSASRPDVTVQSVRSGKEGGIAFLEDDRNWNLRFSLVEAVVTGLSREKTRGEGCATATDSCPRFLSFRGSTTEPVVESWNSSVKSLTSRGGDGSVMGTSWTFRVVSAMILFRRIRRARIWYATSQVPDLPSPLSAGPFPAA